MQLVRFNYWKNNDKQENYSHQMWNVNRSDKISSYSLLKEDWYFDQTIRLKRVILIKSITRSERHSSSRLEDEQNDIHEIGKLGKNDETSSDRFDSMWIFLADTLWFELMILIFSVGKLDRKFSISH